MSAAGHAEPDSTAAADVSSDTTGVYADVTGLAPLWRSTPPGVTPTSTVQAALDWVLEAFALENLLWVDATRSTTSPATARWVRSEMHARRMVWRPAAHRAGAQRFPNRAVRQRVGRRTLWTRTVWVRVPSGAGSPAWPTPTVTGHAGPRRGRGTTWTSGVPGSRPGRSVAARRGRAAVRPARGRSTTV